MDSDKPTLIDFVWLCFVGLQIGLTKTEISQMKYNTFMELVNQWKLYHNVRADGRKWKL